jgi:cardiolipin synthase A/B
LKRRRNDFFPHNHTELIRGGKEYFSLLHRLIGEAKETIHLQTYIFNPDETGMAVANALIAAAQRGVKVYMLIDGYGSQNIDQAFMDWLKSEGVFVRKFQPILKGRKYYLGRRLHHKIVVVDSWRCTVAGLNISDRYNDMPNEPAWLDWALYVEGEVAKPLEDICRSRLKIRNKVAHHYKKSDKTFNIPVAVRVNDWLQRKRQIYRSYLHMFGEAKSHITIMSAYFLPGRLFRKEIEEAVKRGVKIKVVLTANADIFMIKYAERFIYRWLFKNKIEVYEYKPYVLHAKIAFCDGEWMSVGSFNVNNLSAFASIELNLEVKDKTFIRKQEARIEEIILKDCVKITERKFNRQFNFLSRITHHIAYQVFRFLFFISTKQRSEF